MGFRNTQEKLENYFFSFFSFRGCEVFFGLFWPQLKTSTMEKTKTRIDLELKIWVPKYSSLKIARHSNLVLVKWKIKQLQLQLLNLKCGSDLNIEQFLGNFILECIWNSYICASPFRSCFPPLTLSFSSFSPSSFCNLYRLFVFRSYLLKENYL